MLEDAYIEDLAEEMRQRLTLAGTTIADAGTLLKLSGRVRAAQLRLLMHTHGRYKTQRRSNVAVPQG